MLFVRSTLFFICQCLSAVVVSLLALPSLLLPSLPRAKVIGLWARFNLWALSWVCGVSYRVKGRENIPNEPAVIISNHQSTIETLCFQMIFPPLSFILKKQLLWIPFFGWGLAANRPISINRADKRSALNLLIKNSKQRLNEGRWLVVYPEGTRMPPGKMGQFQVGGAMMATRSGAQVVPVAHNAGLCWPKDDFIKYPGIIDVIIGTPIETSGKKPRDVNVEAEEVIKQMMESIPQAR
ncbi:MAG: 1-acyl-sn-glycerol-3-phosphate acyltransferase [Gammaproteobacteria bacterium]|nr:1-acyl-sn-glycerol-3-phosphate acyltransferase [Gammaproteobacteria bacterium]